MHKKYWVIPVLFLVFIVLYIADETNFLQASNWSAHLSSSIDGNKLKACTINIQFDDGSYFTEKINDGDVVVNVRVKGTRPAILASGNLYYAECKPVCYVTAENGDISGRIKMDIYISAVGDADRAELIEKCRDIIKQQLTQTITI